jgi:hypothetical protein
MNKYTPYYVIKLTAYNQLSHSSVHNLSLSLYMYVKLRVFWDVEFLRKFASFRHRDVTRRSLSNSSELLAGRIDELQSVDVNS